MLGREQRRIKSVSKYAELRRVLKEKVRTGTPQERYESQLKLQSLPRDSSATRLRNRCDITGRPNGYYRKVGLGRNKFRELAMQGNIPGLVKASW